MENMVENVIILKPHSFGSQDPEAVILSWFSSCYAAHSILCPVSMLYIVSGRVFFSLFSVERPV